MIYLVIALKPEAQAFVDKYKLTKSKLGAFTLFSNENMKLIVSGMGIENARIATQTLINNFDISDDDIYITTLFYFYTSTLLLSFLLQTLLTQKSIIIGCY